MDSVEDNLYVDWFVDSLIGYADYQFISNEAKDQMKEDGLLQQSIGDYLDTLSSDVIQRFVLPTNLKDLKKDEEFSLSQYTSYSTYLQKIGSVNLSKLRSIRIAEESIKLTNQALEYLCSGGNIEEIKISEERHYLTGLPVAHLSKIRSLFFCDDRNVTITDDDLKMMPGLQLLGLSWNNTITNAGLSALPNLMTATLHGNFKINSKGLKKTNPNLQYIVSENEPESSVPSVIRSRCSVARSKI